MLNPKIGFYLTTNKSAVSRNSFLFILHVLGLNTVVTQAIVRSISIDNLTQIHLWWSREWARLNSDMNAIIQYQLNVIHNS